MQNNTAIGMACTAGDKLKATAREFLRNLETWKKQEEAPGSIESAIQKMFSSCTSSTEPLKCDNITYEERETTSIRKLPTNHPVSSRLHKSTKAEYGEHIYAQLFLDDQREAPGAPHDTNPATGTPTSRDRTPQASPKMRSGKKMFPVSAPKSPLVNKPKVCTPLGSEHLIVHPDFDDAISTISAYTLEAMAQADKIRPSTSSDSTLFPSESRDNTPSKPKETTKARGQSFSRNRSHHTQNSRSGSRTTNTTEDSSFEQRFADDEKNYWKEKVQTGTGSPTQFRNSREKSQGNRKTNDYTPHNFAHPHDTIPFESGDLLPSTPEDEEYSSPEFGNVFTRDPDRLAQVLTMPVDMDTEMGEI